MTRVLVTGAGGFIGRSLVRVLVLNGFEVVGLDLPGVAQANGVGIETVALDARLVTPDFLTAMRVSTVVHMAALVGVVSSAGDPSSTESSIVESTVQLVQAMERAKISSLVYVSSSEVYGEPDEPLITEETPLRPISYYARAKVRAEQVVSMSAIENVTIVRPFNVYGPRQRAEFVVPLFVRAALTGGMLTVVGDGEQTRTFTYIDDFVAGLLEVTRRPGLARCVQLCGDETITMSELARRVISKTGSSSPIGYVAPTELDRPREFEVAHRRASHATATRVWGFVPRVSLDAGLEATIGEAIHATRTHR